MANRPMEVTLDTNGQMSETISTPTTGTVYTQFSKPNGESFKTHLATGAPVDLVTLETLAGSAVDQDAVQTIIDANNILTPTNVTSWPYQMLSTDKYIRATGTGALTLVAQSMLIEPVIVNNIGTGLVTVTRAGSDLIGSTTTFPIYAGGCFVFIPGATGVWDAVGGY